MAARRPHPTLATTVVRSAHQASANLGDEAVIVNLEDGVYYSLDALGARVWELIADPQTVRDVHNVLCNEYDVDAERCKRDLIAFFAELAARGLVDVVDAR